jgi:hypothetical protein
VGGPAKSRFKNADAKRKPDAERKRNSAQPQDAKRKRDSAQPQERARHK